MVTVREGWTLGIGALFGAAAAIIGLLILLSVAPVNALDVGIAIVLLGVAKLVP